MRPRKSLIFVLSRFRISWALLYLDLFMEQVDLIHERSPTVNMEFEFDQISSSHSLTISPFFRDEHTTSIDPVVSFHLFCSHLETVSAQAGKDHLIYLRDLSPLLSAIHGLLLQLRDPHPRTVPPLHRARPNISRLGDIALPLRLPPNQAWEDLRLPLPGRILSRHRVPGYHWRQLDLEPFTGPHGGGRPAVASPCSLHRCQNPEISSPVGGAAGGESGNSESCTSGGDSLRLHRQWVCNDGKTLDSWEEPWMGDCTSRCYAVNLRSRDVTVHLSLSLSGGITGVWNSHMFSPYVNLYFHQAVITWKTVHDFSVWNTLKSINFHIPVKHISHSS